MAGSRIDVTPPEGEGGQEHERERDEGYAAKVRPVDTVLDGGAIVVEGGGGAPVFEVFGGAAYGVDEVHAEEQEGRDGDGEGPAVEQRRAQECQRTERHGYRPQVEHAVRDLPQREVNVHERGRAPGDEADDGTDPEQREDGGEKAARDQLPARQGVAEQDVYGAALFGTGYGVGEREYGEERQGQWREAEELRVQIVGGISEVRDAERLEHTLGIGFHELVELLGTTLDGRERGDHGRAIEPERSPPDDHAPELHPGRVRDEREERPPRRRTLSLSLLHSRAHRASPFSRS